MAGRVVVIGGSNSIMRDGWLPHFRAGAPEGTTITNLAIGGATSLMGLFRLSFVPPQTGETVVIWEYALNEFGHFRQGGHPLPVLMRHVGHVIDTCARRGFALVPVIFSTRAQERAVEIDAYRQALHALFAARGIASLDVSRHFRAELGLARLPDADFQDNFHYRPGGRIVTALAAALWQQVRTARPPAAVGTATVTILRDFPGCPGAPYENRLVAMDVVPFDAGIDFTAPGDLLGLALVTSTKAGAVTLSVGGAPVVTVSMRARAEQTGPNRLVKQISLEGLLGAPLPAAGQSVRLHRAAPGAEARADLNFDAAIDPPAGAYEDALAGVIVELP